MLVGHAAAGAELRAAYDSGRMHHAWLIAGPPGIGKAAFAQAAATWVLARAAGPETGISRDSLDVAPEHPTARLIAAGSHLDFRTLAPTINPRTKVLRTEIVMSQLVKRPDTIGDPLNLVFQTTPALGDWRVVIVDSLDVMARPVANALLKSLEEPPPKTLFLCLSHAPGRLLPTIRSRCRLLRLEPLSDAEVGQVLLAARPDLSPDELASLMRLADGAPGRALRFADVGSIDALTADIERLAHTLPGEAATRALALAKSLAAKTATARYGAFLELAPAALATHARTRTGPRLARALALWEKANALAASAVALSLEPQSVAFELGMLVSGLSES
jgi:DNA polymerase III subunit delta'